MLHFRASPNKVTEAGSGHVALLCGVAAPPRGRRCGRDWESTRRPRGRTGRRARYVWVLTDHWRSPVLRWHVGGGVRPPHSARPVDQAPLPERAPGRGVGSETAALPRERLFLQTRLSVSLTATQPSWRGGRSRQSIWPAASRRGRCRCGGWPGDLWLARLLAPQLPRADRVGGSRKGSHRPGVSARAGHQASRQAPNLVTPPV